VPRSPCAAGSTTSDSCTIAGGEQYHACTAHFMASEINRGSSRRHATRRMRTSRSHTALAVRLKSDLDLNSNYLEAVKAAYRKHNASRTFCGDVRKAYSLHKTRERLMRFSLAFVPALSCQRLRQASSQTQCRDSNASFTCIIVLRDSRADHL
jgi:hypothetical protein